MLGIYFHRKCDAFQETDDHRISVVVVVRWNIEYSALNSMVGADPNLLCLWPEEAHSPLKTFSVVVIMDPKRRLGGGTSNALTRSRGGARGG